MKFAEFHKDAQEELTRTFISMFAKGKPEYRDHFRYLFEQNEEEKFIQKPVFQTIFPWESSNKRFGDLTNLLGADFIKALDNAPFSDPLDDDADTQNMSFHAEIKPYKHQINSWEAVINRNKSILVTTGTGSGKTECFMVPILKQLLDNKKKVGNQNPGIQAIFLYPLNSLIASQRKRVHAWCKALSPQVTYGMYTGGTEEKMPAEKRRKATPQLIDREQLRTEPPQILFTNATILELMMIRSKDMSIVENSQDLQWIILDEAHTYSGSTATEMALLIRRVLQLFGKTPQQVNFAITSATIGEGQESTMREFITQLTGKNETDFEFISGKRVIPTLDTQSTEQRLQTINHKFGTTITTNSISKLREELNSTSALSVNEITSILQYTETSTNKCLEIIDDLSEDGTVITTEGKDSALLPVRAHFFGRSVLGMYACSNPECPSYKKSHINIGTLTTYASTTCRHCQGQMLEIVLCSKCGEYLLQGEEHRSTDIQATQARTYCMKDNTLKHVRLVDYDVDEDSNDLIDNSPCTPHKRPLLLSKGVTTAPFSNARIYPLYLLPQSGTIGNSTGEPFAQCNNPNKNPSELLCPSCGTSGKYCNRILFPASFISRTLCHLLLKQSPTIQNPRYPNEVISEGRKFITFTDNRQGTAKTVKNTNIDVEREWARATLYECLVNRVSVEENSFTEEDQEKLNNLLQAQSFLPDPLLIQTQIDELQKKKEKSTNITLKSISWDEYCNQYQGAKELQTLHQEMKCFRNLEFTRTNYLRSLFLDQMGNRPINGNSLETLGLVRLDYVAINSLTINKVPRVFKNFFEYTNETEMLEDWKNFLRILMDYFIRRNAHILIPDEIRKLVTQSFFSDPIYPPTMNLVTRSNQSMNKRWPQIRNNINNSTAIINRCALLLLLGKGIVDRSLIDDNIINQVNHILSGAWEFISREILTNINEDLIDNEHTYSGYKLNIFDGQKVKLSLITQVVLCPMTRQLIDCTFRGISPLVTGELDQTTLTKYQVQTKFVKVPIPCHLKKETYIQADGFDQTQWSAAVEEWFNKEYAPAIQSFGGDLNLQHNLFLRRPIFLTTEHSAQIDSERLRKSEKRFEEGQLNILSCSTTMEMGVDIGGISVVEMNNVPPKPANYLQRTGRAGRRNETQCMALTLCNDNPIGNEVIRNPKWAMDHPIAAPAMNFLSQTILQRHINAVLLGEYIRGRSGGSVKDEAGSFVMGNYFDNSHLINYSYEGYLLFLNCSHTHTSLQHKCKKILRGTALEQVPFAQLTDASIGSIQNICEELKHSLQHIQDEIKHATNNRFKKKLEYILKSRWTENLLTFLSAKNYLPSASLPTNVVSLILYPDSGTSTGEVQRQLPIAIQEYAPGKEVVLSNWVYPITGIMMSERIMNQQSKEMHISYCRCGYTAMQHQVPRRCPKCGDAMRPIFQGQSNSYTQAIEPIGFIAGEGKRTNKQEKQMTITDPQLLGMYSWDKEEDCIYKIRPSKHQESKILYINKGKGYGYCLCEYCGKMVEETDLSENSKILPNGMKGHHSILSGKSCYGNQNSFKRNVLLTACNQTDISELQIKTTLKDEELNTLLYTLGTILSRMYATHILGINEDEIDFGVTRNNTIFIFDTTPGGAGYSNLLNNHINDLLDLCRVKLEKCNCQKACTSCLIDKRSQRYIEYLNKELVEAWLQQEFENRQIIPSELSQIFPTQRVTKITKNISAEVFTNLQSCHIGNIEYFLTSGLEEDALLSILNRPFREFSLKGCAITIVISTEDAEREKLDIGVKSQLMTYQSLYGKLKKIESAPGQIRPIIHFRAKQGNTYLYFEYKNQYYKVNNANNIQLTDYELRLESSTPNYAAFIRKVDDPKMNSSNYLNLLLKDKFNELDDFMHSLPKDSVRISYTDIYICSPACCILLGQLIQQFMQRYKIEAAEVVIRTGCTFRNSRAVYVDEDFLSYTERDEYLKECLSKCIGNNTKIKISSTQRLPHYRLLTIENDSFEFNLNPDGGIANGWFFSPRLRVNAIDDVRQGLKLTNSIVEKAGDTLRYTIEWNRKQLLG